jgi:hypothetical protein
MLPIISPEQRMAQAKATVLIAAPQGYGKTYQANFLEQQERCMFLNSESGDLSAMGYSGPMLNIESWQQARDYAVLLTGPDKSRAEGEPYSESHYQECVQKYGGEYKDDFDTIFVDSITDYSRICFAWCKTQPRAFSEKTGKPDTRGAYGLLKEEMVQWIRHMQRVSNKNLIMCCIFESKTDDYQRLSWDLQTEGAGTARELPGIVDAVIMLDFNYGENGEILKYENSELQRVFRTNRDNPYGYAFKSRGGRLNPIEPANIAIIIKKMKGQVVAEQ